jgi:hypothetical protein
MGTITNVHGLPQSIVAAVTADPYVGGGDISVTKLIDAPQIRTLMAQHKDKITTDVSERIWSLLGQAVHTILERAALRQEGMVAEDRLYAEVAGWQLSGQFDVMQMDTGVLSDYKVTTVYKLQNIDGWTQQLNVLRWLAHKNGIAVTSLEIIAILRNWQKGEAERKPDSYPQTPIVRVEIPLWSLEDAEEYILDRVQLHQYAQQGGRVDCTDEERWYTGTQFALMKEGGKRAIKLFDERPTEIPEGHHVEERPGEYRRCASYCEVRHFCRQAQETGHG